MKLFLASIVFLVIATFAPAVFGQSTYTNSSGDNQFSNGNNFNPNGVPTMLTNVQVNSSTTLDLPSASTTVASLALTGGNITIAATSSTFTTGFFTVDANATVNLDIAAGGTVTSANQALSSFVGDGNGAGTLNLTGAGTLAFLSGGEGSGVGFGGVGVLNQSGSTAVQVGGSFGIGGDGNTTTPPSVPSGSAIATGGTGTYNLGGTATFSVQSLAIGIGSGTGGGTTTGGSTPTVGTLNITSTSANALVAGAVELGTSSGLAGSTVANTTGVINQSAGTVTVNNFLTIGVDPGAVGLYNLSGGVLNATGQTELGQFTDSSGTLTQTGGTMTSDSVKVGLEGTGVYLLQGGTATMTSLDLGGAAGGTGILTQSAGSALTVNGSFTIGVNGGTGIFNYNGGTLTTQGFTVGAAGTFNQNASLTLTTANTVSIDGGTYNFNPGTLNVGGNTATANSSGIFTNGSGSLNFSGGTLVTTSAFTDTLAGSITGTSTINLATAGATFSGLLSGNGTLNVIGGNALTLTNTGNQGTGGSWGVNLSGGGTTLNATVQNLVSAGKVTIGAGSIFNLTASTGTALATDVYAGAISGDGTLNTGAGSGTGYTLDLVHKVALSSASTTTIAANDQLEAGQGTFGTITGAAGSQFVVGGVSGGTVSFLNTATVPSVAINSGSTLFASNIVGSVTNGGTLTTFGTLFTPSTLLISGSLTSTGTLVVHSNGLKVDTYGTAAAPLTSANLTGSVSVTGIGTITNVPIVYTTGGVTPNPTTLVTSAPTALYSSSVSVVGNNLVLSTVQLPLGGFAQTPNQSAVAGALDPIINRGVPFPSEFVPMLASFNTLSAGQIPAVLEQLSPESLQYARNIAVENSTYLAERLNGVDGDIREGYQGLDTSALSVASPGFESGMGRSLGSLLAYNDPGFHAAAPNGVNYYPGEAGRSSPSPLSSSTAPTFDSSSQVISDSPNPYLVNVKPGSPETPAMGEFIGGDVILADLNKNSGTGNNPASKASYTAGDVTAGVSFRVTNHFAAGVLFDYNHTDAKTDSAGSKTKVDTYSPGVFATYYDHGFYANGLFSFGYNNYTNTRNTVLFGRADSSPSGQQYVGDLDFGYDFHPDKAWIVGPTLGATYTHLDIDSFTETGAPGADLSVQDQSVDSLRSRLGGHLVYQTNTGDVLLQPNFMAVWQHEFLVDDTGITSSFSDIGSNPFTIQTVSPARDSALIGVGLTASLNNSMALYINYLADVGASDYFSQSVIGGFKARF